MPEKSALLTEVAVTNEEPMRGAVRCIKSQIHPSPACRTLSTASIHRYLIIQLSVMAFFGSKDTKENHQSPPTSKYQCPSTRENLWCSKCLITAFDCQKVVVSVPIDIKQFIQKPNGIQTTP